MINTEKEKFLEQKISSDLKKMEAFWTIYGQNQGMQEMAILLD